MIFKSKKTRPNCQGGRRPDVYFTQKEEDGNLGFTEVTLEGWREDTEEQEQNSQWRSDWQVGLNFDAYQETGGSVIFEAEHYHKNHKGTDPGADTEIWQINHAFWTGVDGHLGHRGSGFIEPPQSGSDGDANAAYLEYRVYINTPGTYHLALRMIADSTANDSIQVYINDVSKGTIDLGTADVWTWKHASTINLGTLATGLHTLKLIRKEDGLKLDRIAIADSTGALPADGSTEIVAETTTLLGRPASAPPAPPASLTAMIINNGEVEVFWQDTNDNETSFTLHRSTTADFSSYVDLGPLPTDTVSFTDTSVSNATGTTYYYRIQVTSDYGISSFTDTSTVAASIPSAPIYLHASKLDNSTVLLEWTDTSDSEAGFILERSTSQAGVFVPIGTILQTQVNATSYQDTSAPDLANQVYYYRVRARNVFGESDNTPTDSAGGDGSIMPSTGLVLYYPFENEASASAVTDQSGNENDGTISGTGSFVDGYIGEALEFDSGGIHYIETSQNYHAEDGQGYAASAWIKLDTFQSSNLIVFQHLNGDGSTGRSWMNISDVGRLRTFTGGEETASDDPVVTIGTWHHVAMSAGEGKVTLYVDGVVVKERDDTVEENNAPIRIGNQKPGQASVNRQFDGLIDEVRVYGRRLTQSEVELLAGQNANDFPTVDAGANATVWAGEAVSMAADASDDSVPAPLSYLWETVSGPTDAVFNDDEIEDPTATLPAAGVYTLRLTISDGWFEVSDAVVITAQSNPASLTVVENSPAEVSLSWPPPSGHSGYLVQLRKEGEIRWTTLETNLAASETSYVINGLIQNQSYEFKVTALTTPLQYLGASKTFKVAPDAGSFVQATDSANLVVIEAESPSITVGAADDSWLPTSSYPSYSGTGAMILGPGNVTPTNWIADIENTAPMMGYDVYFRQTGTHYLWVRAMRFDGNTDSLHGGIDGVMPTTAEYISRTPSGFWGTVAQWTWLSAISTSSRTTLEVPSVGTHTINIYGREDGIVIDKILLTTDSTYTPNGATETETLGTTVSFTPVELWRQQHFGLATATGEAADDMDNSGDGMTNRMNFAFNADPFMSNMNLLPTHQLVDVVPDQFLEMSFRRRTGSGGSGTVEDGYTIDGITYNVEVSPDLSVGSWQTGNSYLQQFGMPVDNGDGTETVTVRVLEDLDSAPKKFIRLQID